MNNLFNKITNNSSLIKDICFINTGFDTSADKVTKSNLLQTYNNKPPSDIIKGDGIFIINEDEYEKIKPEKDLIYKCFKNSDINKYYSKKWQNLYVIWTNKDTKINKYPRIKNHLKKYEAILKYKATEHGETLPWYSQHRAREFDVFSNKDKIVLPYRSKSNIFSYSNDNFFGSKDILYLRQRDKNFNMKYLLALLNSKLYYTWLYYKGKRKGETLELYVTPVGQIPIKKISKQQQLPFITIVNYILHLKEQGEALKSHYFEQIIDGMVYELYFEQELKTANKDILQFLQDLPAISKEMPLPKKTEIINQTYEQLNHVEHEVKKRLSEMARIREVRIIEGKEKNL